MAKQRDAAADVSALERKIDGGRLPIQRYLCLAILNRLTFYEFDQFRKLAPRIVVNDLPTDALYDMKTGSEPQRSMEVIQSWEAVKNLNGSLVANEQEKSLRNRFSSVRANFAV